MPDNNTKGVVLDKDGKPCRPCTSFAAWASQTKASKTYSEHAKTSATVIAAAVAAKDTVTGPPLECPANVETLGRGTWTLLHTIAAQYPTQPTAGQQADVKKFFSILSRLYPCWVCAEDFQEYLVRTPVRATTRDELGQWLCAAHNEVNRKLGKPMFDCGLWEERWRTGWKDGRCN